MKNVIAGKIGGFTLVELLVVVLIIGILTSVALPQYEQAVMKSRLGKMMTTVRDLKEAMELYRMANGSYIIRENVDLYDSLDITPSGCENYNSRYTNDKSMWSCPGDLYFDMMDGPESSPNLTITGWWGKDSGKDAKIGYSMFLDGSDFPGVELCLANSTNELAVRTCKSMGEEKWTKSFFYYGDRKMVGYIIE